MKQNDQKTRKSKNFWTENGKWVFSRESERKFFFFMTLFMLVFGLITKWI